MRYFKDDIFYVCDIHPRNFCKEVDLDNLPSIMEDKEIINDLVKKYAGERAADITDITMGLLRENGTHYFIKGTWRNPQ